MSERWDLELYVKNSSKYIKEFDDRAEEGKAIADDIDFAMKSIFEKRFRPEQLSFLDIPCGIGRISIPLCKKGYLVTGVDYSEEFLSVALRKSISERVNQEVSFFKDDMYSLSNPEVLGKKFDVIINYWTSFGYREYEDDASFFKSLLKVSHENTLLVVETWHRENVILHPLVRTFKEIEAEFHLISNNISPMDNYVESKHVVYKKNGDDLERKHTFHSRIRLYSSNEISTLLHNSGWKILFVSNNIKSLLNGIGYEPSLDRIFLIAEPLR